MHDADRILDFARKVLREESAAIAAQADALGPSDGPAPDAAAPGTGILTGGPASGRISDKDPFRRRLCS